MLTALVAILAVASQTFLVAQGGAIATTELKELCEGKNDSELSVSQVKAMAEQIGQESGCPQKITDAIRDMSSIIAAAGESACADETINAMSDFYSNYLENDLDEVLLPKPLEQFALSFAMRMSQSCKANMIMVLTGEAHEHVTPEDLAAVDVWAGKNGEIDKLLAGIAQPGSILMPSDFAALIPNLGEAVQHMALHSEDEEDDVQQIKTVCDSRLRPVYEQVVRPVAQLTRNGFDYPDLALKEELGLNEKQVAEVDEWARVVLLCEVMTLVDTYESESKTEVTSIIIVSEQELPKLTGHQSPKEVEPVHLSKADGVKLTEIELMPESAIDLLSSFLHEHITPVDRLQATLRHKVMAMLKNQVNFDEIHKMFTCNIDHASADENLEESATPADKQMVGRRRGGGGCCGGFTYILYAVLFAGMMMMIAAG